jgi:hypothetical protein
VRCPFFCFPSLDSSYLLLLFLTVFSFSISTAFPFSFFSRTIGSLLVFLVVVVVVVDGRCNFAAVSAFLRENRFSLSLLSPLNQPRMTRKRQRWSGCEKSSSLQTTRSGTDVDRFRSSPFPLSRFFTYLVSLLCHGATSARTIRTPRYLLDPSASLSPPSVALSTTPSYHLVNTASTKPRRTLQVRPGLCSALPMTLK